MSGVLSKLKSSLSKTRANIFGKISSLVLNRKIDDELLEEFEETLIEADVGVKATGRLIETVKAKAKEQNLTRAEDIIPLLKVEIATLLSIENRDIPQKIRQRPEVWLIIGVNGAGKTTTIGKLSTIMSSQGKKVIIAACDTFRAAAVDQIAIWAERSNVDIVKSQEGSDPAAVAFDAATAAKARKADLLLVDTAGRLHTKTNLMEELKKIKRTINKVLPDAAVYSKLVIDGSTGQNAISQVKQFGEAVGCDGIIITKLDGTAKGGVVIAIAAELQVPIEYIGIGEGIEDLQSFDAREFTEALFC
ncbi:MAG: signal recognition particle-docking protein FtsY [candidate division Zixibacteria bacterium]|nr:signal recognition particle-docking protein FtsY [candidate division Zixibacteria bacterium]